MNFDFSSLFDFAKPLISSFAGDFLGGGSNKPATVENKPATNLGSIASDIFSGSGVAGNKPAVLPTIDSFVPEIIVDDFDNKPAVVADEPKPVQQASSQEPGILDSISSALAPIFEPIINIFSSLFKF